jgi:hypothetical protein
MMSAFDVRPTNESIRKGLKQHPIRRSHNNCQCCKLSKCPAADIACRTISFTKAKLSNYGGTTRLPYAF